eukprot:m.171554 g.171554  ORF g.171554 m.171554 type:complete len:126 (-) comp25184_c1_seq2:226-603(-)
MSFGDLLWQRNQHLGGIQTAQKLRLQCGNAKKFRHQAKSVCHFKVVNRLDRDLLHQAVPSLVFARRQAASSESGQEEEDETDEELESTPKKSFLNQSLLSQYGLPPEQLASLEALIQKEVEKRKQ